MVQEPTSYIYLGVDDLLKNGRSQDSIYILEPSNTRLFFNKHQRYKHLEPQIWPKNKHILCTTPEPRFRQIPIFKIWLFYNLL